MVIEVNVAIDQIVGFTESLWLVPVDTLCFQNGEEILNIITPPDAVIILHQGAFCLLSVFTGSVQGVGFFVIPLRSVLFPQPWLLR